MSKSVTKPYHLSIRVGESDWIRLNHLADELNTPKTNLVERAVSNYLQRFFPEKKSPEDTAA